MFDINEKIDAFLKAPLHATVFDYFMNFLPYFANQFSPLFTFIAVIFFTSKLADNSEIIAMLSAGMSYRRLMLPYMFSAAVIAVSSFLLSAYVIPPANERKDRIHQHLRARQTRQRHIQRPASGSTRSGGLYRRLQRPQQPRLTLLARLLRRQETIVASHSPDPLNGKGYTWRVKNYVIRDFGEDREIIRSGQSLDTVIPIEPSDFIISKTIRRP